MSRIKTYISDLLYKSAMYLDDDLPSKEQLLVNDITLWGTHVVKRVDPRTLTLEDNQKEDE